MKKHYLLILFVIFISSLQAQITVTQVNMPHAGDTARLTQAQTITNYTATGPNHVWSFPNLRAQSQRLEEFLDVAQTNVIYALFYSNLGFNPNRSNVAAASKNQILSNPLIQLENPYDFFYRNNSVYKQTGLGAEIAQIPIPIPFSKHDTIYRLPINYPGLDSSNSQYSINIPQTFTYASLQKRKNVIDGWGVLTTPYGTYDVLRVKTTLTGRDSVYVDAFSFGFSFDKITANQYKWLTDSVEVVPVLQVNTIVVFGFEIVTEVLFRDNYITAYPVNVDTLYCAGASYTIDYIKEGTYNSGGFPGGPNNFRVQLSDANGSFANPVVIGSVQSIQSGSINVTIPANTPAGTGYRVRIISTNLAMVGPDNGFDITIAPAPVSSINSTPTTICDGDSVVMTAVADPDYVYQWQLNGTDISGATGISYTATQAGVYTVVTTNSCTSIASPSVTVTINPLPVAVFNGGTQGLCNGDSTLLTANTIPGYTYQWQWNGFDIPNANATDYYVTIPGDYALVVSGICGTDTSVSVNISFVNAPVSSITAAGPTTFCSNDSVVLSAQTDPSYLYQWQLDGTDINGATNDTYIANVSGVYHCIVSNACDDVVSNDIAITVNQSPIAGISSVTTEVCVGDSILLTSLLTDASFSYQWQLNGTDVTGANASDYYVTGGGNYTLVVSTSACGTATSQAIAINEIQQPTATVTASGNVVCTGDSLSLSTNTDPGYSYQWQLNGVDISGANASDLFATQAGDYNVITTNQCNSVVSNILTLTVDPQPQADFTAATTFLCSGDSGLLSANVVDPSFTYQWQLDGIDIPGANGPEYYAMQQGDYTLVVSTANCGSETSAAINVTVAAQVTASFTVSANTICAGDTSLLSATFNQAFTYQWQLNGVDIPNANSSDYSATVAGDYSLIVNTTQCGSDSSQAVTINVIQLPVASISTTGATTFCDGDSALLTATTDPGYSYQWQLNGVDITGANTESFMALQSGVYTAIVSNTCGNEVSNSLTIDVVALPVAAVSSAANGGCYGDSILISAGFNPSYTYQWQLDGNDIIGANDTLIYALGTGNYSVIVSTSICGSAASVPVSISFDSLPDGNVAQTGSNFFCNGDSMVLNGIPNPNATFQWQLNGVDLTGATTPDYVVYTAGIYNLLVTNACATVSSPFFSATIFPNPDTTMYYSGSTVLCTGDTLILNVINDPTFTYQWSIDGISSPNDTLYYLAVTQPGTYQVQINSIFNCGKENSTLVTVSSGLLPVVTITDATFCQGDSALLLAQGIPPGTPVQWWYNGSPLAGATDTMLMVSNGGTYQIQYWNNCDTLLSNVSNVTVNPLPAQPVITQNLDTLTSSPALIYQWYLNGNIIPGPSTQSIVVTQNGNYTVVVTDANGCTNISQVFVYNSTSLNNQDAEWFAVTPNPFIDYFEITFAGMSHADNIQVKLFAANGSLTEISREEKLVGGTTVLRFVTAADLAPGVYMLMVNRNGNLHYTKLIKQ